MDSHLLLQSDVATNQVVCGIVLSVDDHVIVELEEEGDVIPCDLLHTSSSLVVPRRGDRVLLFRPPSMGRGVVLGRIDRVPHEVKPDGEAVSVDREGVREESSEAPESLVLEAKHSLTLRVGEGSITIREDGKILIKGKDLVSHAQRMNRIKGGAVSIN